MRSYLLVEFVNCNGHDNDFEYVVTDTFGTLCCCLGLCQRGFVVSCVIVVGRLLSEALVCVARHDILHIPARYLVYVTAQP